MSDKFKACVLEQVENKTVLKIRDFAKTDLMEGDVFIKIHYSSFNYKDGLAITGKLPVVKTFPMIPGVDFSGTVIESQSPEYKKGDKVILNGWGVGEKHYGGFSEYARVKAGWLIKMPEFFNFENSMVIGSAGYTASLCVLRILENIEKNKTGDILISGASGGVGSIATHLLSNLGYSVTALSGKNHEFLFEIGAKKVISRNEFEISNKPLGKEKWMAAIDTVGGDILSTILSETKYNGIVASTGLAKSPKLDMTVFPFILRNITLAGVDCVYASKEKRINAWKFLESNIDLQLLDKIKNVCNLNDIEELATQIIHGMVQGRTVIKII